ncbi:putative membrane protein [Proteus mirabilis]|nr:hypothetical protein BB2000_0507 [Proteus mirabilis BB2000]AWF41906.1 putative membrane protein [Proteus mirabilis]PVF72853.1 putative membrane protein [Proteus mirabilis]
MQFITILSAITIFLSLGGFTLCKCLYSEDLVMYSIGYL